MKKFVICLILIFIIIMGISFFKYKTEATECWWGVLYPTLSYVGFEDDTSIARISTTDTNYLYIPDTMIKMKFLIVEWLKSKFSF